MKKTAFEELLTSVRQAGRIRRGAMKPSRVTKARHVANRVRTHDRRQRGDPPQLGTGAADSRWPSVGSSARGFQKPEGRH